MSTTTATFSLAKINSQNTAVSLYQALTQFRCRAQYLAYSRLINSNDGSDLFHVHFVPVNTVTVYVLSVHQAEISAATLCSFGDLLHGRKDCVQAYPRMPIPIRQNPPRDEPYSFDLHENAFLQLEIEISK